MSQPNQQPDAGKDLSPLQQSYFVIKKLKTSLDAIERQRTEPIAIVGAGCRFPGGAVDLESYWRLLHGSVDTVQEVPRERWDVDEYYHADPATPGKTATRCAAFLDQVDRFDPLFFGISPREAVSLDPQQRLLLEVSWEALERAGLPPDRLAAERTGTFVGIGQMDYAQLLLSTADPASLDVYAGTGNGFCFSSGRLSYVLGLRGPNMALDTACSSSLVSVHLACQSLRSRECDLALAGGVQLMLSPRPFIGLTQLGAISRDGRCKTFDAAADGYGRGEGCGMLVLKRLSDALAAGDQIAAIIRGSAVNHDGASSGFTVPNGLAQQELLRRALENAGVKPAHVGYIETHGTGTQLGDPIEVEALSEVFGHDRAPNSPLMIGSVKTNIGHLEAAAGIAGLLKVVLALQHAEIPAHLHFKHPNPHIKWSQIPVKVPTAATRWETIDKRIAGVSSFGLSGTNAHIVLEEAPEAENREAFVDRTRHVLPLSARTPNALAELAKRYEMFLGTHPDTSLGDFCFTCATGRTHLQCRAALVAASVPEMRQRLAALAASELSESDGSQVPKIAFLFTGQGSQYAGMGQSLYKTQPSFRATLKLCEEILRPHLERPLLEVVYPDTSAPSPLHETAYTQPALFALEYALATLWMSWGVEPGVMMGHSVGEYVAACLAGVFSLEDGLKLIALRARLMQSLPRGGEMAVVFADERTVAVALETETAGVAIAALNGLQNTVISGDGEAIGRLLAGFERTGVRSTRLHVSHAFHSPLMEPMLSEFERVAREVRYQAPRKGIVANLEGKLVGAEIATPEYWVQHVRRPVKFAAGMATLERLGCIVFMEIGPKPALLAMGRRCVSEGLGIWLPSLSEGQEDWQVMLQSLGKLYERRARIHWPAFDRDYSRRRMVLPTYPFQRQRFWLAPDNSRTPPTPAPKHSGVVHPFLGARLRLPLSRETRFETRFSLTSPAYLQDHCLFETVVVPGASHLAMVLCAIHEAFATNTAVLEDLFFPQALVLNEERSYTVQTILLQEGDTTAFRVVSLADGADEEDPDAWTVHFSGRFRPVAPESEALPSEGIEALRASCSQELSASQFYSMFRQAGYGLGDSFQWIGSIWQGEGEAVARMRVPGIPGQIGSYQLYPGLIDSCFQLFAACWRGQSIDAGNDDIFVPFTIGRFHFYRAHREGELWCHTRIRKERAGADGALIADTRLFDDAGRLVAEIVGFEGRRASRKVLLRSLRGNLNDALYELVWRTAPPVPEQTDGHRGWLVFCDRDPVGAKLIELLQNRGDTCIAVEPGPAFERLNDGRYQLSPDDPAHFARLLQEVGGTSCTGIVHLWSMARECTSVLYLLRALAHTAWKLPPRLWLVTRNAVAAGPERRPIAMQQSPLWGLGRVIAMEHPELRCVRIDLDTPAAFDDAQVLMAELAAPGEEDQVAFRAGQRHVARLARLADTRHQIRHEQPAGSYKLAMNAFGVLDELRLMPMTRQKPGRGEVEVAVRATGLNLRDVLLALGMFNEQLAKMGISRAADVSFGFEFAGEVTAVGAGVDNVKPGDAVMGSTFGGMNSHIIADAKLICAKPSGLSFEQAATIPVAFMSAYFGMHHLAQIKPGETMLIHAAAGGVGQAALQLARNAGVEVFATASPAKWDHLASQGVRHVMNSRTLEFAGQIMVLTGGRGVDCVLNSLAGEFMTKSLDVLAEGGRFIELGKFNVLSENEVRKLRPDVRYLTFDMAQLFRDDPGIIGSMFKDLIAPFQENKLEPIVYNVFPIQEAAGAFRFMAQAKHVGKVILSHAPNEGAARERVMIREDAVYAITGGLGALGIRLADWMVSKGARNLVLAGRSEPSPAANESIGRMRRAGANVTVVRADVSDRADVERLLSGAALQGPVRGIVHAAGVLEDGTLINQDWPKFRKVMAPKVEGAWNLHELSQNLPLDFFICYSSIASLLGSPGQGNYAAANAFLDALAHHRRALGQPALTINWGPWAGDGMAAHIDGRTSARWAANGFGFIQPDLGLDVLEQLWTGDVIQAGVQPLNWSKFLRQFPAGFQPPLLEAFQHESGSAIPEKSKFLELLENTPLSERLALLQDEIRAQIAGVLGLVSLEEIELRARLFDLGLDSLMAVELKARMERTLCCVMRQTLVFDYPTVEALANYFAQEPLAKFFAPESQPPEAEDVVEDSGAIADQLARELSELAQGELK